MFVSHRNRLIAPVGLIVMLVLLVPGCARPQPKSASEELQIFAADRGCEWLKDYGILQGRNVSLLTDVHLLTAEALKLVKRLGVENITLEKAIDLNFLSSLNALDLSRVGLKNIALLNGLQVKELGLDGNPISDISPLANSDRLEQLFLSNTQVELLPSFSKLTHLKMLYLSTTPIKSLKNLETIPSDFDLNIMYCKNLTDIDALLTSRVRKLFIDSGKYDNLGNPLTPPAAYGTYDRFKPWFDEHLAEIKAKNPNFKIKFALESGL